MAKSKPSVRREPLQWNAGGWFGGQLGGTLWLLLLGILLFPKDSVAAAVVLCCFAGANLVGLLLWRRRRTGAAYPATQIMIAACGVASLAALAFLDSRPSSPDFAPSVPYWVLLVFPAVMLMFHLQQRQALRQR
jgi:drug/metabolite transporter (DMT)-like permease